MGGKIEVFVDCNSPYSYIAVTHLSRVRAQLQEHGVTVEYHPFFLGGVMQGSGNQPPWKTPAKAKMSGFDIARVKQHFNVPNLKRPEVFPIMSLLPMRAMCYVKEKYPAAKLETTLLELWIGLWEQGEDLSKPEVLAARLEKQFSGPEAQTIVEAGVMAEYKQALAANTERALKQGAYGAPWFWVTNGEGREEPFFGSDRFNYMYTFLKVPYNDMTIVPKGRL